MNYRLEFTAAAKADVRESYNWYEQKFSGLGNDFLDAMEDQIQFIRSNATSIAIFVDDYRKGKHQAISFQDYFFGEWKYHHY